MHSKTQVLQDSIGRMLDTFNQIGDAAVEETGYFAQKALRTLIGGATPDATYLELWKLFYTEIYNLREDLGEFNAEAEEMIAIEYSRFEQAPTLDDAIMDSAA